MEASDRGSLSRENKCAIALWCVGICVVSIKLKKSCIAGGQGIGVIPWDELCQ